jgi:hypothetical protein
MLVRNKKGCLFRQPFLLLIILWMPFGGRLASQLAAKRRICAIR